jgi:hypothetical protein
MVLLINEPSVIETIIVPSLMSQFHSSDTRQQSKALCGIGRLGNLASREESVKLLSDLLVHSPLDKTLVISSLRATGARGEQALNRLYKKVKSSKTKSSISYFLGKHLPPEFADHIEIAFYK